MSVQDYFQKMNTDIQKFNLIFSANNIPGFLRWEEGYALYSLAMDWPIEGDVVEIGSFKGKSTCFLGLGCAASGRGKVFAIDHFQGSPEHQKGGHEETPEIVEIGSTFEAFKGNVSAFGLNDVVCPIQGDSTSATESWDKQIRLLFIDGDHSYEGTKRDFMAWQPHVAASGLICLHDYQNSWYLDGVTKFIDEELAKSDEFLFLNRVSSLVVFMKR